MCIQFFMPTKKFARQRPLTGVQEADRDARTRQEWFDSNAGSQSTPECDHFLVGHEQNSPGADFSVAVVGAVTIIASSLDAQRAA
jgi:hypothetical protein